MSASQGNVTTAYTYDSLGNIKTISENGKLVKSYVYDALGQLVREDDAAEGITITYTYNAGGNITWKKNYEYTAGSSEPGAVLEILPFSYDDSSWKDMLTTYKGRTVTYDEIGPLLPTGTA